MFDLHFHSTASDGEATLAVLRGVLAQSGLAGYALADHDYLASSVALAEGDTRAWTGIELAIDAGRFRIDVLALNVRPDNAVLNDYLVRRQAERQARFTLFGELLRERGWAFDPLPSVYDNPLLAQPHVVAELRRQPANMARLIKIGARDGDTAIYHELQPLGNIIRARVEGAMLGPQAAFAMIHAAGGLASLAHPIFKPFEEGRAKAQRLIAEWATAGLDGIEVFHPNQEEAFRTELLELAQKHHLLVGAGSDDHTAEASFIGSQLTSAHPQAHLWWAQWQAASRRYR